MTYLYIKALMNTHYCKVGTIRPNLNKNLNSTEKEKSSIALNTKKTIRIDKLSK